MKHCNVCNSDKNESEFNRTFSKKDGLSGRCRQCSHDAYESDSDHFKSLAVKRYRENRTEIRLKKAASYVGNRESISLVRKKKRAENPGVDASSQKMKRVAIKALAVSILGGACPCGVDDVDVLCVDHVNDDGQKERKSGVSGITIYRRIIRGENDGRYQLLCFNCNLRKSILRDRSGTEVGAMRTCPTCLVLTDLSSFKLDTKYSRSGGRYYECRKCVRNRTTALKARAMAALGHFSCLSCGSSDVLTLSFDHVNDDGCSGRPEGLGGTLYSSIVDGSADRSKFQILCMNCNIKKHVRPGSVVTGTSPRISRSPAPPDAPAKPSVFLSHDVPSSVFFFEENHRSGYGRYGAFHVVATINGETAAVAKFAAPLRKDVASSVGLNYGSTVELDRVCVRPGAPDGLLVELLSAAIRMIGSFSPNVCSFVGFTDPWCDNLESAYVSSGWKDSGSTCRGYRYVSADGSAYDVDSVRNDARRAGVTEPDHVRARGVRKSCTLVRKKFVLSFLT
jgi:5-methylcytosine-specific restriction endonuclease McrA